MMLRHGFLAAALTVLATLRVADGDWLWAAVFGAAAATELGVLAVERRRRRSTGAAETNRPARPGTEAVEVSLRAHRQGERLWWAVLAVTLLVAAVLVWSEPSLAVVVAAVALVALARVRRQRRTVAGLQRLVVTP